MFHLKNPRFPKSELITQNVDFSEPKGGNSDCTTMYEQFYPTSYVNVNMQNVTVSVNTRNFFHAGIMCLYGKPLCKWALVDYHHVFLTIAQQPFINIIQIQKGAIKTAFNAYRKRVMQSFVSCTFYYIFLLRFTYNMCQRI